MSRNRECGSVLGAERGVAPSARISLSTPPQKGGYFLAEDLSESKSRMRSILGAVRGKAPSARISLSTPKNNRHSETTE